MTAEQKHTKLINDAQQLDREANQYQADGNEVLYATAKTAADNKRVKAGKIVSGKQ